MNIFVRGFTQGEKVTFLLGLSFGLVLGLALAVLITYFEVLV